MRVVITQSNYIPWKGYFDSIDRADVVVLYDDVQYTRRDWRNRNRIKTAQGLRWLTIPVGVKGKYHQLINEVEVAESGWTRSHWSSIAQAYTDAPAMAEYRDRLFDLYQRAEKLTMLSDVNHLFLTEMCGWLAIETPFRWSTEFNAPGNPTERLVAICRSLGATTYLSGPAAKSYLEVHRFTDAGIAVEWADYRGFPPYQQPHGDFEEQVSIVDAFLNLGDQARHHVLRTPGRAS